jgi:hypothetical protein
MNSKQQYISVFAICLTVIVAAAIITYKPLAPQEEEDTFKFPVGIPPSLGTVAAISQGGEQVSAIYVSGSGSASEKANQATVTLGVMTEDPYASVAVEDNAELMTAVINAIKALDIPEDKIKTVQYSVYPDYDWELRRTTGYRVTNMVEVEIEDLEIIGNVIDDAVKAGANNIQGVSFGLTEEVAEGLKIDAYKLALQDAKGKADLIAETLGLRITGVLSVSESVYYPYVPYRAVAESAAYDKAPTPIIEGTLSVSVSVQVSFTFEQIA